MTENGASRSDWEILRRYLSRPGMDTYKVNLDTLSPVEGSYERAVSYSEASAALSRLESRYAE